MLVTRKRNSLFSPILHLNDSPLEKVNCFKYLGIWLSSDLSWSKHIDYICDKARRLLGFFYRSISDKAFLYLLKSQVLPILEFGCSIWDPHLKKDIKKIESVQLYALRLHRRIGPQILLFICSSMYHF